MSLVRFGASAQATAKALTLAGALLEGPQRQVKAEQPPFAYSYGVCGVGVVSDGAALWPAIVIEDAQAKTNLTMLPATDLSGVRSIVQLLFREDAGWLLQELRAVAVQPCAKQAEPGDAITVNGILGQLGAPVRWNGRQGFLTAGHVGQAVGSTAVDAQHGAVGTTVYVSDPTPYNGSAAEIDVALVELTPPTAFGNRLGIVSAASAQANDAVTVYTRVGPMATNILAYCAWFYASMSYATYSDIYLSSQGLTKPGDSGGPVLLAGTPGTIVGHVVAGGNTTTCIQDVQRQMAKIRTDRQFNTLSL